MGQGKGKDNQNQQSDEVPKVTMTDLTMVSSQTRKIIGTSSRIKSKGRLKTLTKGW